MDDHDDDLPPLIDQQPDWRAHLSDPIWEDWELDPEEVARRESIEAERRRGLEEAAAARAELRAAIEADALDDSDDVSDDDDDDDAGAVPAPSRGAALRYRARGAKKRSVAAKLDGDNCMLECYAQATAPRPLPREWPPEPSLAGKFYGTPPGWAAADNGAHFVAIENSPFALLPEEILHILVLFIESKTLLSVMPAVCRLFGSLARREGLWKNVCQIRGWGEDVEGAPAVAVGIPSQSDAAAATPPSGPRPLASLSRGVRPWWQATRRWSAAMMRTKALYDELIEQPGATEWEELDDDEVSALFAQLLALPGFSDGLEEGVSDGSVREPGDSERSPENLQKTLDGWRDTASRVDVGLQCWFRLCGGFKMELSMNIMGNDLQGPIFFFPLLHLASATRLTVDMLRRPTTAEIRKEMHAPAEPEPESEPGSEPESESDSSGSEGFQSAGDSEEAEGERSVRDDGATHTAKGVTQEAAENNERATGATAEEEEEEEGQEGKDVEREKVPLAYELEYDEDDFVQPALRPPQAEPEPEPEPEPDPETSDEGAGGGGGRRTRCPMLVTATQALGPDGSPGGGTSLLPIAVFLESQHVICVVLPAHAASRRDAGGGGGGGANSNPFSAFGGATFDGQLVALKWSDPGWSVRPLLKTFPVWLKEIIADTKGLAWRSDALYSVD